MKTVKYYVVDILLNTVSDGYKEWYLAEHAIRDYLHRQGYDDCRDVDRFKIIPKWEY
jgi:hypothetical protein